jgi:hypothetical protein
MSKTSFIEFIERDLTALEKEVTSYVDEKNLWVVTKGIKNSPGNLCLHLIGSLNHFVGAILGKTGYVRDRDKEFSTKDVSRTELLIGLEKTKHMVTHTLTKLSTEQYNSLYPIEFLGKNVMTDHMLLQMATHINYHLGQINYHRRLLDKK